MGQAPPHATPAPSNPAAPTPTPIVLSPGTPVAPPPGSHRDLTQPPPPGARPTPFPNVGPGPTPAGRPPVGPPQPGAVPGQPGAPSPANAPQVVYEGQPAPPPAAQGGNIPPGQPSLLAGNVPTTASIRKMGGAMGPGEEEAMAGSEALPTAPVESPKVTITVKGKSLDEIFNTIREKTGVRIKSMGATGQQKMDLIVRDMPVEDVLNQIATAKNYMWAQLSDGSYELYDKESWAKRVSQSAVVRSFQLHFVDAEELQKIVQPLLTPEIGVSSADVRSNKLIVTDVPSKLALVESLIREYDVQVYTHVFEIKNVPVDTVTEQLDKIKSKAGEMYVDQVNRVVVVKDTFDKIKMMEQLVQILDRDVEMRVYNMLNIGIDAQAVDDFISKFIEPLKSTGDQAIMEYNMETGKLFVRDVRSVHEKILQILRQVDVPRKQVRIEGEIVSVAMTHDQTLGLNWVFSPHLDDAIRAGQAGALGLTGLSGTESAFNTIGLPIVSGGKSGLRVLELTDNVKAELTAALSDSRTRLLLRPRITISNNEEGTIEVQRNEPVLQTYNYGYGYSSGNPYGASSGQMTYTTGLMLMIRPTISNRGLVEMEIEIQNTTPIIVPDIGGGIRGVGSSGESASTVMIVPSGETRVIGGLISRDNTDGSAGIPYLSSIPYLGFLFGEKTKTTIMRNLMFFITPTIIEEEPLNDDIVQPVNPVAESSMQLAQQGATPPTNVGEIPPELRPYLQEIRPEAPWAAGSRIQGQEPVMPEQGPPPEGQALPTEPPPEGAMLPVEPPTGEAPAPTGEVSDEAPLTTETMSSGERFLSNEPAPALAAPIPGELRTGGAVEQIAGRSKVGPSGTFAPAGRGGAPAAAPGTPPGTAPGGAPPAVAAAPAATTGAAPGTAATQAKTATPTKTGTQAPGTTSKAQPRGSERAIRSRQPTSPYRGPGQPVQPGGTSSRSGRSETR